MARKIRFSSAFAALGLVTVGFLLGCMLQKKPANADKVAYRELEKFSKVLQYIESDYVEERKTKDLIEGAIQGMIDHLDPHSAYMTPEIYKEMKVETTGKFGGLGIEVSVKDGIITVLSPIDDTPAYKAGIKTGDRIVKIGDKSTKNMTLAEAVTVMRGKPGTKISIALVRAGVDQPMNFTLTRESIKMQSVRSVLMDGGVGYMRIASFTERTADELSKAIDKVDVKGNVQGIILDLRGNPGGLLDQAVKVVNLFVDEGPIVYTIGRDTSKKEAESAQKGRLRTKAPIVVLVDGSSASAAEIVAGALQDYGRAVIAGQRTFGKGSVQTIIPMGDDAGLKLTVARYYTPSGRSIQAKGIVPDVEIEDIDPAVLADARNRSKVIHEADLEGHFASEDGEEFGVDGESGLGEKPEKPPSVTAKEAKTKAQEEALLPLEERVKKDYMIQQARGVLKTMSVVRQGLHKPEFRLDKESVKSSAKSEQSDDSSS